MQLLLQLCLVCVLAVAAQKKFEKERLEAVLRRDHSDKVSNVWDSEHHIQYTWNIEKQELCVGVDGKCDKDEL
jgi:hypothetical protein|tara:strand:- start:668 stop:886 length:219 start_codon:yes stop_codon:yes gene_type:complete